MAGSMNWFDEKFNQKPIQRRASVFQRMGVSPNCASMWGSVDEIAAALVKELASPVDD